MKRDFSFSKKFWKYIIKWSISFLISASLMLLLILLLTPVQKQFRLSDSILRTILMTSFTLCAAVCAFLFRKFSKVKGYICGLTTGIIFSVIKLCMSILGDGVGKSNLWIYFSILPAAVIGGILSANQKKKQKW